MPNLNYSSEEDSSSDDEPDEPQQPAAVVAELVPPPPPAEAEAAPPTPAAVVAELVPPLPSAEAEETTTEAEEPTTSPIQAVAPTSSVATTATSTRATGQHQLVVSHWEHARATEQRSHLLSLGWEQMPPPPCPPGMTTMPLHTWRLKRGDESSKPTSKFAGDKHFLCHICSEAQLIAHDSGRFCSFRPQRGDGPPGFNSLSNVVKHMQTFHDDGLEDESLSPRFGPGSIEPAVARLLHVRGRKNGPRKVFWLGRPDEDACWLTRNAVTALGRTCSLPEVEVATDAEVKGGCVGQLFNEGKCFIDNGKRQRVDPQRLLIGLRREAAAPSSSGGGGGVVARRKGNAKPKPMPTPTPMLVGQRVLAQFGVDDDEGWFPGVVAAVHADGKMDVQYDDGDEERRKDPARVRREFATRQKKRKPRAPPPSDSEEEEQEEEGEGEGSVEAEAEAGQQPAEHGYLLRRPRLPSTPLRRKRRVARSARAAAVVATVVAEAAAAAEEVEEQPQPPPEELPEQLQPQPPQPPEEQQQPQATPAPRPPFVPLAIGTQVTIRTKSASNSRVNGVIAVVSKVMADDKRYKVRAQSGPDEGKLMHVQHHMLEPL